MTTSTAPSSSAASMQALTLGEAVRLALTQNPELAAARLELQAMEGAEIQAGARPNPEVGVLVEDTRSAARTTTLQWSQAIELGGKRSARLAAAARAREQAGAALQAKQAELRAAVTSGFFEVLGAQEQVRLTQASLDLAHNATLIAGKRVQAGKVPPLEQGRAQVAEAGVRAELAQAQSDLLLARQRLAAFWGQGKITFDRADGNDASLPELLSDQRIGELLTNAPAIRIARMEIARRQALTDTERAKRVPDLTVTLGAKRAAELGRTQAVVGFSIPLPVLDTNQGNLLEALRREEQAREVLNATSVRVQAEVSQSIERLRLTREQVQLLRSDVLPLAQTTYDAAVKGYELGKFAFIDVLDAQRTLFQLRQQVLRGTAEAYRAAADLDRLLGRDEAQAGASTN
ncbi:TolC family protein [Paucibacter sp. JuS9]|uniref:TolC family protein n=1 Tax=Paucibacter sp. JuS9 TaxID=3228748 RepID=UPI003757AAAD